MNGIQADDFNTILIRLLLAVLAGGIIGFERAFHGRTAPAYTALCIDEHTHNTRSGGWTGAQ